MSMEYTGYPSIDRVHLQGIDASMLNPTIFPISLLALFLHINGHDLDAIALERDAEAYTRKQLADDTVVMATGLYLLGLKPGETITIATPNLYEGVVLTMAANAIGIKFGYANGDISEQDQLIEQLSDELNLYESSAVVVYEKYEQFANELFARAPKLRRVISIKPSEHRYNLGHGEISNARYVEYDALKTIAAASSLDISELIEKYSRSDQDAFYLQTSGSTSGRPKGLIFGNEAVLAALMYAKNSTGTDTHDKNVSKVLCILPYRIPYGWMTLFVNLLGGNRVELATGASPKDIGRYYLTKASYIYGTPLIFRVFMDETPPDADLSFLKAFFCSGFAISEEWYQEGTDYLRAHGSDGEIRNNWGIGEALCVGTASDGIPHRPGTSGKFYIGPTWVIVDEENHEVKYDESGEAILRSKSLFRGYFKDPEATKKAFTEYKGEKYFRTGDFLSLSRDGYVTFLGRKKRFYQPLGATDKVNCETIERALLKEIDIVKTCAVVIYKPDGKHETSKAFVVLRNKKSPSRLLHEELTERIKKTLLPYQLPSDIVFLDKLPVMKSGKIDYTLLESMC